MRFEPATTRSPFVRSNHWDTVHASLLESFADVAPPETYTGRSLLHVVLSGGVAPCDYVTSPDMFLDYRWYCWIHAWCNSPVTASVAVILLSKTTMSYSTFLSKAMIRSRYFIVFNLRFLLLQISFCFDSVALKFAFAIPILSLFISD